MDTPGNYIGGYKAIKVSLLYDQVPRVLAGGNGELCVQLVDHFLEIIDCDQFISANLYKVWCIPVERCFNDQSTTSKHNAGV